MKAAKLRRMRWVPLAVLVVTQACAQAPDSVSTQSAVSTSGIGGGNVTNEGELLVAAPNITEIELLTATSGVGSKPLFEWAAVNGAARYSLTLFDQSGIPYWAWEGGTTSVYLGGGEGEPPEDAAGPVLQAGMSWGVLAFDAEGQLMASSVVQAISP